MNSCNYSEPVDFGGEGATRGGEGATRGGEGATRGRETNPQAWHARLSGKKPWGLAPRRGEALLSPSRLHSREKINHPCRC